jgi:CDP-6-deoxy-D-xylo-4-hexulose-3-dehydrase
MRIIRAHGWVRETKKPQKYFESFPEIDKKFLFVNLGYNLRLTEVGGAMGSVQLPKLKGFVESRRNSAQILLEGLSKFDSVLSFQKETPKGRHSWFGFPIIVKPNSPFSTKQLREYLESHGIETRPIIAGNIANQPAVKMYPHRVSGDLKYCSNIMVNGLAVACHQSLSEDACNYIIEIFNSYITSFSSK